MKPNAKLDPSLAVFRPRFLRLLSGRYSSADITDLFRFLRSKARKGSIMLEIGDLVAHPEARNRGLAFQRLRDTIATKI